MMATINDKLTKDMKINNWLLWVNTSQLLYTSTFCASDSGLVETRNFYFKKHPKEILVQVSGQILRNPDLDYVL